MWHLQLISYNVKCYHNRNNNRLYQYLKAAQIEYKHHEKRESPVHLVNKDHSFPDHAWIAAINHPTHLPHTAVCSWWLMIILEIMSGLLWTRKIWAMYLRSRKLWESAIQYLFKSVTFFQLLLNNILGENNWRIIL